MNRLSAFAIFVASTVLTALCAPAQDHREKVTVPFNFNVGDRSLPAGTYMLGAESSSPYIIHINNWEKKVHLLALGRPEQQYKQQRNAVVFRKYGGQYFLSTIQSQNASMDIYFPTTKAEKRARKQLEVAGLVSEDPVLLALN